MPDYVKSTDTFICEALVLAWLLRKPTRTIKDLARSSNFKGDVVDTKKKCKGRSQKIKMEI